MAFLNKGLFIVLCLFGWAGFAQDFDSSSLKCQELWGGEDFKPASNVIYIHKNETPEEAALALYEDSNFAKKAAEESLNKGGPQQLRLAVLWAQKAVKAASSISERHSAMKIYVEALESLIEEYMLDGRASRRAAALAWAEFAAERRAPGAEKVLDRLKNQIFQIKMKELLNDIKIPKSDQQTQWELRALRGGDFQADKTVLLMYLSGLWTPRNEAAALRVLRKAEEYDIFPPEKSLKRIKNNARLNRMGEKGSADALFKLGHNYWNGVTLQENRRKGNQLIERSAALGHPPAQEWITDRDVIPFPYKRSSGGR